MTNQFIDPKLLLESDLFVVLGIENLTDQQNEQYLARLIDGLQARVMVRLYDLFGAKEGSEWVQVVDTENADLIRQYIQNQGVNLDQIITEEALLMKAELLSIAQTKTS